MTTSTAPDPLAPSTHRALRLALLQAATLLLAGSAQAQSPNCDKLRQTLSQRIEAGGVTGYGLDILPAKAPSPSGGKVIGTCDGGAYKAVYRRFGGPPLADAEPAPPPPAPATVPAPTPVALKPQPQPKPEPEPPRPAPPPPPPPAAKAPEPAPAPSPPAPAPAPVMLAAAAEPSSIAAPPVASAPAPAPAEPAASQPEAAAKTTLLRHGLSLFTGEWRWLWALLLLPLAGWLWARANHRRQYDAAGLPRGPRL